MVGPSGFGESEAKLVQMILAPALMSELHPCSSKNFCPIKNSQLTKGCAAIALCMCVLVAWNARGGGGGIPC